MATKAQTGSLNLLSKLFDKYGKIESIQFSGTWVRSGPNGRKRFVGIATDQNNISLEISAECAEESLRWCIAEAFGLHVRNPIIYFSATLKGGWRQIPHFGDYPLETFTEEERDLCGIIQPVDINTGVIVNPSSWVARISPARCNELLADEGCSPHVKALCKEALEAESREITRVFRNFFGD